MLDMKNPSKASLLAGTMVSVIAFIWTESHLLLKVSLTLAFAFVTIVSLEILANLDE